MAFLSSTAPNYSPKYEIFLYDDYLANGPFIYIQGVFANSCMERGVAIAVAFKKILDTYRRLGSKPCHGCHFIWI